MKIDRKRLNELIKINDIEQLNEVLSIDNSLLKEVRFDMMLPLNFSLLYANNDTVRCLLDNGADPNQVDSDGLNSFYNVVWNNRADLLEDFLRLSDANIDTMINLAANKGYTRIASVLLDKGAYLEQWRIDDLFYLSCLRGQADILKIFVEHGSPLDYEKDEVNVLTVALRNKHKNVLVELMNLGYDEVDDENQRQPIDKELWFDAIKSCSYDMVRHYIAKYGRSSVFAINENNKSSLDIACETNNEKLFEILYRVVSPLPLVKKRLLAQKAIANKNMVIINLLKKGK